MKATIDIPDVLYREAETRTASEGTTIDGIFVTLLGGWLESRGWHPEFKTECVITDVPKRTSISLLVCPLMPLPA